MATEIASYARSAVVSFSRTGDPSRRRLRAQESVPDRKDIDGPGDEFQQMGLWVPTEEGREELADQATFAQHGRAAQVPQRDELRNEARLLELCHPVRQKPRCHQYQYHTGDLEEGAEVYPIPKHYLTER